MDFTITCTNYDMSYKKLLSNCSEFIRDNYIEVLKQNKHFDVQHYIIKCVCNESVPLYVYEEHKHSHLHKVIIKKNTDYVGEVCKQYLLQDIVGIIKLYMY
jgi:hypothetical protein